MGLLNLLKGLFRGSVVTSGPRAARWEKQGTSYRLVEFLRAEEPGWITMQEAKRLFSPVNDAYAARDMLSGSAYA
jgi:hypothetical protein